MQNYQTDEIQLLAETSIGRLTNTQNKKNEEVTLVSAQKRIGQPFVFASLYTKNLPQFRTWIS